MSLASTSRVQVAYKAETAFGVTPSLGNPRDLRVTGESLDFAVTKTVSTEINASRAVSSVVPTGASSSGGVNGEMQYAEYDELIAATLQSTWAAYGTGGVGTTFAATWTSTTLTADAAPTGANAFTTLKKGQWFQAVAPTGLNKGKYFRVSKTTAPTTTVITLDPNTPAQAESAIASTAVSSSRLTNGTLQSSFSIERQALDIGQFMTYRGMTPSKLTLAIASAALTTIQFDFMGKDMVRDDATGLPGTLGPSYSYDIQSGVSGTTCQLWEGGAPMVGAFVKSLNLSYDNALRGQDAICTLGSIGIASGQIACQMTAEIYFADGNLYDKFLANDYTEVSFSSMDPSGNGYFITLPRSNISTIKVGAGAKDQDMMLSVTFNCMRDAGNADASLRQVIFIDRVGVAYV